ncbi:branched-chain amino acid ABC transporter permease [Bordetella holmesii]|uniref:Branched-chain amino acid ABC transporter, permease protein n=3 Tax=Bordetella holmesii TaxID=35814 RepID=A0A158M921_9BORD|nr:branched-chain amino acid ABC transporter permease [Bordetella holmesii]AHV91919.1 branched-chain amino acid transport system / permease component family protein [Bordetella holmesii ATCC 51541]AIT27976.1 branched-chain amino acid transport system / permease component family protein [Bordetella holmesii 44057]EWM40752.1 branched-chain amino acid transport system / permease component family protein [Bordetella holmesii 35009]EWM41894.1 branched-chain amino acid transport system / permease com
MNRKYLIGIAVVVLLAVPALLDDPFVTHLSIRAATYAIVVMGLTLFVGCTGQISLGHAAYFGLAAYVSGMLAKAGVPYILAALGATAATGLVGALVGLVVLRTSGHYLALASIAVAIIIQTLIKNASITGGPSGLTAVPPASFFGIELNGGLAYYYYVLAIVGLGLLILHRVVASRTGDALQAIANNELAAQSLGIPVFRYKVLSFTISVMFAAFAGTLLVHYDGFVDPERLGTHVSILFLIMAFVGGIGSLPGALLGAFSLTIMEEYTQEFGEYNVLIYGLTLAVVILFMPKGLISLVHRLSAREGK